MQIDTTPKHFVITVSLFALGLFASTATAQCPELGPLQNHTGVGVATCPCFIAGEEAGVVLDIPADQYPIIITKIGITWASQFGGAGQTIEQAIHIYPTGLPNPGVPIFSLVGPQLTDGVINEFDIEPLPGDVLVTSGPFAVTLEFLNTNSGDPFAPTVVHDNIACQVGKNLVKAIPGGWIDACLAGVSGDWAMYVKYRSAKPGLESTPEMIAFSGVELNETVYEPVVIRNDGCDTLVVAGIGGCDTAPFSVDSTGTDHMIPPGDSTTFMVCVMPTTTDADSCEVTITTNAGTDTVGGAVQPVRAQVPRWREC